jgi:hypothetical protein
MSLFPQRKNRNLGPDGRKVLIIPQAIGPEQANAHLTYAWGNTVRTLRTGHITLFDAGFHAVDKEN